MAKCKARFINNISHAVKIDIYIYDRVDVRISVSYIHTCFIYLESHESVRSDGGGGSRIPVPVPLDLPLELTEEYIIKAVFICVPEHRKSDTEETNGSFFICKAE